MGAADACREIGRVITIVLMAGSPNALPGDLVAGYTLASADWCSQEGE